MQGAGVRAHFPPQFARHLRMTDELDGHNGCVNRLAWNHEGSLLASGSDDRRARFGSPSLHTAGSALYSPVISCHQHSRSIVVSLVRIVCSVNSGFSLGQAVQVSSICLQETSFQAMRLHAVHSLHVPVGLPPPSGSSSSIGVANTWHSCPGACWRPLRCPLTCTLLAVSAADESAGDVISKVVMCLVVRYEKLCLEMCDRCDEVESTHDSINLAHRILSVSSPTRLHPCQPCWRHDACRPPTTILSLLAASCATYRRDCPKWHLAAAFAAMLDRRQVAYC